MVPRYSQPLILTLELKDSSGRVVEATAQAVLNRDPSRLRMYEREDHNYYHSYIKPNNSDDPWSYEVRSLNVVDVHATQYPEASYVDNWTSNTDNKLPYFQQEYAHAMGQSFGSFTNFWNLNRTKPNAQGGFIWDWMDQTRVTTRIENGTAHTFWGYGGDWIDQASNADAFCGNGVIYADRTPSSRAIQMRYDHQQVNFYPVEDHYSVTDGTLQFKVVNEYENTDLSAFHITWKLMADTEELGSGTLNLSTAPMTRTAPGSDAYHVSVDFSSDIVTITLPSVTPKAGVNYLLNFSVENKNRPNWDTSVVTYDNVVAYEQFDLTPSGENAVARTPLNLDTMNVFSSVENSANTLKVSGITAEGGAFSFQMDKTTGIISNYTLNGKVVLEKGPVPSFWRAMTYNDTPTNYNPELRNANDVMSLTGAPVITIDPNNKHIKVELDLDLTSVPKADAAQTMTYDIYSDGEIVVSSSFTPNSDFAPGGAGEWALPKIGLRMTVAPGYENLEYLGRGPDETYADRKTASLVDLYRSTVSEQFITQYIKPQENGNRTDVRWTSLTNSQGEGLMVVADGTVETSALHVKAENINLSTSTRPYNNATYRHSTEVPMDAQTYWCIDAMQRGVSNTGFFNHIPLPGFYPTTTGLPTYSETFRIVPVDRSTNKMAVARLGFTATNQGGQVPAAPHTVTVAPTSNGTVSVNTTSARAGESVSITAVPAQGYVLSGLSVTKTGDSSVYVNVSGNIFVMPDYDVTVSALFTSSSSWTPGGGTTTSRPSPTNPGSSSNTDSSTSPGSGSDSSSNSSQTPDPAPSASTSPVTVPVSGSENAIQVTANVVGSTATVHEIDTTQIENVIGNDVRTGMVEIDFTTLNQPINTVNLPAKALGEIAKEAQSSNNDVRGLSIKLSHGEISLNGDALAAVHSQAGDQITMTIFPASTSDLNSRQQAVVGDSPVFTLSLQSSGKAITDFKNGVATVSLPYTLKQGQNPTGIVVYYLDDLGNIHPCDTMYDVRTETVIFTTTHLSLYMIGYDKEAIWENPFSDVKEDDWFFNAVRFAAENNLMGGYGDGLFGPNHQLTRAQLAQILYNKEGKPAVKGGSTFSDVKDGQWYADAVLWAAENGIVNGYPNGSFGPNDNINREQLATMLWRYAGKPSAVHDSLDFPDGDAASPFALEALCWTVEQGIINGYDNGKLDPQGLATRAQAAKMLMSFLNQ